MAQAMSRGRFVWQELMTEDTTAASAFYTRLLGWSAKGSGGDPAYTEFYAGAVGVGGMMKLPDSAKAMGAKAMWMPYIGVDHVDDSVKEIEGLGGKTVRAANDIPGVGRFAVVSDPQGAVFAVFTATTPPTGARPSGHFVPGEFSWNELATTDHEAAFAFYSKVFGWQALHRHDMGPMGTYLIFGANGVQYGGMFKMDPHHGSHPFWLPYAAVADVDASAKVVNAAGGRVINGPMDVPGEGRIAQLTDPSGVMFAIHAQKAPAQAAAARPAAAAHAATPAKPAPAAPKPTAAAPARPAAPTAVPKPSATPAVKPAPVTTPPTLKPAAPPAPPKKAAPKPAAAAPKPAAPASPAAAKAPPRKKPAARKSVARKPTARKKAASKKAVAKRKAVARVKTSPKKPAARKSAAKAVPKKHKEVSKKDKKKRRKEKKKDKKARRKK
jgi:predicted enzyme related to lactoylglutathione lyase